jgi:hypothetical protein
MKTASLANCLSVPNFQAHFLTSNDSICDDTDNTEPCGPSAGRANNKGDLP